MKRTRALLGVAWWFAAACVASCTDGPSSVQPPESRPDDAPASSAPVVVSDPLPGPQSAAGGSPAIDVAYVSLPPGSFPGGVLATVRNRASNAVVAAPLVDGGFDPVAVRASAGDTLAISIELAGRTTLTFLSVVPPRRKPVVVRTDPPPRKRAVPLNAVILIVFSEPVDPATLTAGAVQLRTANGPVPGRVELRDAAHLTAAFVPTAPLAPETDHELVITQEVRDVDGEALEAVVTITFTTAAAAEQFTITVAPAALSIAPGGRGRLGLMLIRATGFADDVQLSAAGVPAGVGITFGPPSAGSVITPVSVDVGAAVATGDYPIVIRASSPGTVARSAALKLTVSASAPTGNTTARFCAAWLPSLVAFQDGDGPWTAARGSGDTYTFDIASGRGAFAIVHEVSTGAQTKVYYGTPNELNAFGQIGCEATGATKTVHGSLANLSHGPEAFVTLGTASTWIYLGQSFTLEKVPDEATDLVASHVRSNLNGSAEMVAGIIRRNQRPAANSTMAVLDFGSAEAFSPAVRDLTVTNRRADLLGVSVFYRTASMRSFAPLSREDFTEMRGTLSDQRSYSGVPNPQVGDLHMLTLAAEPVPVVGTTTHPSRQVATCFRDAGDKSLSLPPQLGPSSVILASTSPYLRLRFQYTLQAEFNFGLSFFYAQSSAGSSRWVTLTVAAGYLGSTGGLDLTSPDFSGVEGWNNAWGFVPGGQFLLERSAWGSTTGAHPLWPWNGRCEEGGVYVESRFTETIIR